MIGQREARYNFGHVITISLCGSDHLLIDPQSINYVHIFRPVSAVFIITNPRHILSFYRGKTRTFKPRRDVPEGTKQYQLRKYAEATLVRSQIRVAIQHPINQLSP